MALGRDSYSFELAEIVVAASTEDELEQKYRACVEALGYEIEQEEELR